MNNNIKFRRNVYIILLSILIFGIVSQLARSDLLLKYVSNDNQMSVEQWKEFQRNTVPVSMLVEHGDEAVTGKHCMLYDSADELSVKHYDNFQEVYRYIQQPYSVQDVARAKPSFDSCEAVIVLSTVEVLTGSIAKLERYIDKGGYVFFTRMDHPGPIFTQLYRKLGIVNYWYVIGNNDIEFTSNLLIGQKGVSFTDDYF